MSSYKCDFCGNVCSSHETVCNACYEKYAPKAHKERKERQIPAHKLYERNFLACVKMSNVKGNK
nr:MAG TPA: ABC transporter ATP-binding protein [Caudoviricetes sp.]